MPRKRREDHPGAWHHVMNRSIDRLPVFADDIDCRIFLSELRDATAAHAVEVHSFCLLSNHYHLLLFTPDGGLSEAMQIVGSRFTQAFNRRRGRDGPIFRGRFKSVAVETDSQLVQTSRYIHLNPVEAGLVAQPELWQWSSARAFIDDDRAFDWLRTGCILEMIGTNDPRQAYRNLLGSKSGSDP